MTTIEKRMISKSIKEKPPEEQEAIVTGILTPILLEEVKKRLAYNEGFITRIAPDMLDKLYEP